MAGGQSLGELKYKVTLDTSGAQKGVDGMNGTFKGIGATAVALGNIMANAFEKVAQMVGNIVKQGVQYNAQIEQYQTALTTLTGSADEANRIIKNIKEDAAKTPFDVKGLTQANQLLISAGVKADTAREDIIALGNAISATGGGNEELSRMAVNLQQIKNVGKASALDIKQFAYAGIDVYGLLADSMGITREEATKLDVTYEQLTEALRYASQEGGKYFGAMENQSRTLNGQISTLKDNFMNFAGEAAQPLFNFLKDTALPVINGMISGTMSLSDGFGKLADAGMKFVQNFIEGFSEKAPEIIQVGLKIVGDLIKSILSMLPQILQTGINIIVELAKGIAQMLPTLIPLAVDTILTLVDTLLDNIDIVVDAAIELTFGLLDGILIALPMIIDRLPDIIMKIVEVLTENMPKLIEVGNIITIKLIEGIVMMIPQLLDVIAQIIVDLTVYMAKQFIEETNKFLLDVQQFFDKLINATIEFIANIIEKVKELPNKIAFHLGEIIGKIIKFGVDVVNWVRNDLPNIINGIIEWFKTLPTRVKEWLDRTVHQVIQFGVDLINRGRESARNLVNGIIDTIANLPERVWEVGKNIVEGLWRGIQSAKDWLINKVKNLASSLLDGMKSALGIHSPSKVFQEQVGKWIPEGVAIGIEANTDSALESIDKMNNEMLDKMSSAVNLETSKMSFSGIKGSVTDILNSNSVIKVENYNTLELDGEKVYENQKTIQKQKNLQYGFGGVQ